MAYLTDGFVADWWVKDKPKGVALAKRLVAAGFWYPTEKDGEHGWQFHEFVGPGRNDSREQVLADREKWRKKKESQRATPQVSPGDSHRDTTGDTTREAANAEPAELAESICNPVENRTEKSRHKGQHKGVFDAGQNSSTRAYSKMSPGDSSRATRDPTQPNPTENSGYVHPPRHQSNTRDQNGAGKALDRFRETNLTARSLDAYRIAEAFSSSLPTPIEGSLLAGVGVQIDKCLKSNIPPPAIAAGLKAWTASDSWSPTQIPSFVHKANNRPTNGKPTAKALGHDQALAELLEEVQTL
jgi:hypothetical protein